MEQRDSNQLWKFAKWSGETFRGQFFFEPSMSEAIIHKFNSGYEDIDDRWDSQSEYTGHKPALLTAKTKPIYLVGK